jgi:hypothetical protein
VYIYFEACNFVGTVVYTDSVPKMVYVNDERGMKLIRECINDFYIHYWHPLHTELHIVYSGVQDNLLHEMTPNFRSEIYVLAYIHQIR